MTWIVPNTTRLGNRGLRRRTPLRQASCSSDAPPSASQPVARSLIRALDGSACGPVRCGAGDQIGYAAATGYGRVDPARMLIGRGCVEEAIAVHCLPAPAPILWDPSTGPWAANAPDDSPA